ncbi:MAG: hypothetical protein ACLP9S_00540 [Syntrophales bacterium]|jgi:hypothetical protein
MKKAGTGKIRGIKEDTLIVTIDIGLEMNRGYCTTTDGRDIKPFRFDNTREGLDRLWSMIVLNKNRFGCNEVIVGYESTGPYGILSRTDYVLQLRSLYLLLTISSTTIDNIFYHTYIETVMKYVIYALL